MQGLDSTESGGGAAQQEVPQALPSHLSSDSAETYALEPPLHMPAACNVPGTHSAGTDMQAIGKAAAEAPSHHESGASSPFVMPRKRQKLSECKYATTAVHSSPSEALFPVRCAMPLFDCIT